MRKHKTIDELVESSKRICDALVDEISCPAEGHAILGLVTSAYQEAIIMWNDRNEKKLPTLTAKQEMEQEAQWDDDRRRLEATKKEIYEEIQSTCYEAKKRALQKDYAEELENEEVE